MYNQREKNRSVYIKTCPQQPFEVFHFVHLQILLDTNRTYSAPIGAEYVRKKYDRTDSALFGVLLDSLPRLLGGGEEIFS